MMYLTLNLHSCCPFNIKKKSKLIKKLPQSSRCIPNQHEVQMTLKSFHKSLLWHLFTGNDIRANLTAHRKNCSVYTRTDCWDTHQHVCVFVWVWEWLHACVRACEYLKPTKSNNLEDGFHICNEKRPYWTQQSCSAQHKHVVSL